MAWTAMRSWQDVQHPDPEAVRIARTHVVALGHPASAMNDLFAFVRAQLDDDERAARAADALNCNAFDGTGAIVMRTHGGGSRSVTLPSTVATHIARWDPARVLAEVEAKRKLLQQFELRGSAVRGIDGVQTGGVWDDMLRLLALSYADRPGYREEWRP